MKKITAIILSVILAFAGVVASFAFDENDGTSVPVVIISGHGTSLSYNYGEKSFGMSNVLDLVTDTYGDFSKAVDAYVDITKPFILKGILHDDWQEYYDVMYEKVAQAFEPVQLDCNGNPKPGTGVDAQRQIYMSYASVPGYGKLKNGEYGKGLFPFYYDWRLDPYEIADKLNDYIEKVKVSTGKDKVGILSRCLGTNVVMAYVAKYGTNSLKGVGFDVAVSNGSEFVDGLLTGKFNIDGYGLARYVSNSGVLKGEYTAAYDFGSSIIASLEAAGVFNGITNSAKKLFYSKIQYGIISALGLSTVMTFPGYWGMVSCENFYDAVDYVFGSEGSSKRTEYAGLLDKITRYNETVKKNTYEIMSGLKNNGVNVAVVAKYGIQPVPFTEDFNIIGDEYSSITKSSYGATTSVINETLSDEYIKMRTEQGLGKYISPDKQIDASTCILPDSTWFLKGNLHGNYLTQEDELFYSVIDAPKQLTVDDFEFSQFVMCDMKTDSMRKMTEQDCGEYWHTDESLKNDSQVKAFVKSVFEIVYSFAVMIIKGIFAR